MVAYDGRYFKTICPLIRTIMTPQFPCCYKFLSVYNYLDQLQQGIYAPRTAITSMFHGEILGTITLTRMLAGR